MFKKLLFASSLLCAISCLGQNPGSQVPVAQLPQTYIDTTYSAPSGTVWAAHTSAQLGSALSSANPGDMIVLDAGATYTGNFTLSAKSNPNNQWIYIISSALASLPAPGTRVNPVTDAVNMPKVVTNSMAGVFNLPAGTNHYRFVGLELYSTSNQGCNPNSSPPVNCYSYQLVFANSVPNKAMVDSMTVDRCYLHGSPTQDIQHAIEANASNFAIVDSYISDIHQSINDSQAIMAYYSPGPLKIVNNYLSATGQEIMFGGAGGLANPWVPSDIEIRNNYLFKDPTWAQPGVTLSPNNKWVVKNNLEFKSARRVLVDSNTIENIWVSGQSGYSVMLTPRTNSSGLLAVVDDITIRNNIFKNVTAGFDHLAWDNNCLVGNGCTNVGESKRVNIVNNLILFRDPKLPGGASNSGLLVLRDTVDLLFQHNTLIPAAGYTSCNWSVYFDASGKGLPTPPASLTTNVWVLDNVLCRQPTGPGGVGTTGLNYYMANPTPMAPRFLGNVMYVPTGDTVASWPANNYASTVQFVYVNPSAGNYQLSSPNYTSTSDGQLAGINNATLP